MVYAMCSHEVLFEGGRYFFNVGARRGKLFTKIRYARVWMKCSVCSSAAFILDLSVGQVTAKY